MKNLFIYGIVAIALIVTSCDKKEDTPEDKFSSIPVEQHKTNIEDEGIAMLDEIKQIENEPAIDANISMVSLMVESTPFKSAEISTNQLRASREFAPIFASANIKKYGVKGILKSTLVNPSEDPSSIQEFYDELVGIYEWNPESYEWDKTESGNVIVIKFPAVEGGTVNNASYTVSYVGYTGTNPLQNIEDFDYEGDIPQNFSAILAVDGAEVSRFAADAVYNSDGYPTAIDVTFSIGEYVWNASVTNTINTEFDAEASFKHADQILLKLTLGASGNWTKENIEDNVRDEVIYVVSRYDEESGEWIYEEYNEPISDYDYKYDDSYFDLHKVVKKGNALFQAMNMKIVGTIDAEGLGDAMLEIDDTYNWNTQEEEAVNAQTEAMNKYISLSLRYADSGDIIALVEAYPVKNEYTYEDWIYNFETGEYDIVEKTEIDYWFDMRFVFADDSKVDMETYFTDGFDDLIDELDDWANELENTYLN